MTPTFTPFERLLTAKEVALMLAVPARHVHAAVKSGALRASRVAPNRKGLRFEPDDVRAYIKRTRV